MLALSNHTWLLSAASAGVSRRINFGRLPGRLPVLNRFLPRPRLRAFGLQNGNQFNLS